MNAYCFIDGAHLREAAKRTGKPLVDPRQLASNIAYSALIQLWRSHRQAHLPRAAVGNDQVRIGLSRIIYYDAVPDEGADPLIEGYWSEVELLPDTEIGFGALRGSKKRRRQKRVDSLIAVDMLEGAFNGLFEVAILITADSDFVPVVQAVRRRGVMVTVAACEPLADELRRAADRVWIIDAGGADGERSLFVPRKENFAAQFDVISEHAIKGAIDDGAAESEHAVSVGLQPPGAATLEPGLDDEFVG